MFWTRSQIQRLTSLLKILPRPGHRSRFTTTSKSLVQFSNANWNVLLMIAAEVLLTSSSKTNKMRRKLLNKLMALNLAAKRLKFSFTSELTRTRTRSSPSQTTTFTFRACLKVPVRPSFKNCSRNSVKFYLALCVRQTQMIPFQTLGLFASKMQVQPTKQLRN